MSLFSNPDRNESLYGTQISEMDALCKDKRTPLLVGKVMREMTTVV